MKLWAPGVVVAALVSFSLLSGCGVALPSEEVIAPTTPAVPGTVHIGSLHGTVFGGGIPIGNARVFLYAANQTGYGITTTGAVGTRSTSLLNVSGASPGFPISQDTVTTDITYGDYAVTTDPGGGFNITGDYTCTAGQQLYLVSLGGNPGYGGTNSSAGLMTALPNCPATGGTLAGTGIIYIFMNEVSTVAAAYAMAGFAHDAVHVGAPNNTLAQTGITNAFANASNLYNYNATTTGHPALASGSTTNGGTITRPQATVNTLANILQYCVNTLDTAPTGTSSPTNQSPTISGACTNLFSSTGAKNVGQTTAGTTSTTATAETATAAIFIAQHPGTNVSTLYSYAITSATAYTPKLTAAPNDLTLALVYTGGGLNTNNISGTAYISPAGLAIDAAGEAWQANNISGSSAGTTVSAFSSLGVPLSSSGFTVGNQPKSVAFDQSGYAWITNLSDYTVSKLYATATGTKGAQVSGSPFNTSSYGSSPYNTQIDGSGNAWVISYTDENNTSYSNILELSSSGAEKNDFDGYFGTGGTDSYDSTDVAISPTGLVWITDGAKSLSYSVFSSSAAFVTDGAKVTNYPAGRMAFDSSGNMWVGESATYIEKVTSAYSASTITLPKPSTSYTSEALGLAIDGGGNVWYADFGNATIRELNNSGTALSPTYGYICPGNSAYTSSTATINDKPDSLAIDASGNVWYRETSTTVGSLVELVGAATPAAVPLSYAITNSEVGTRP